MSRLCQVAWVGWTIVALQSEDRVLIHDLSRQVRREESFLPNREDSLMPTSAWYQGESLKQLLQGAALGAFATLGIGFSWGGFMLGSTAKTLADKRRLGDHAREQGGRFRRIASLRRHSQQLEVGYERYVQHNGRRSVRRSGRAPPLRLGVTGMRSNDV